jgi:hypothetical protein
MVEVEHPEVALFAEFPTAQLLSRLWSAVVPLINIEVDNIFSEVARAGWATTGKTPFTSVDGDWYAVEARGAARQVGRQRSLGGQLLPR